MNNVASAQVCENCLSNRRILYKKGFCKRCFRWAKQLKESELDIVHTYKKHQASIALLELAKREQPLLNGSCHPLELESMFYAVATECRSEMESQLSDKLHEMSEEDRLICYKILLEIVENTPKDAPVLSTLQCPKRGKHSMEWSRRLTEYAEKERRKIRCRQQ